MTPGTTDTTVNGGVLSSGLTPDQQEMVERNEYLEKTTADLLEGAETIGGLGTQEPTTDGYGEGTTITIQPVD